MSKLIQINIMKKIKKNKTAIPSFTIDGKRQIIKDAVKNLGESRVSLWLMSKNIQSLKYFNDHVRKFGPKYFRELYNLSKSI